MPVPVPWLVPLAVFAVTAGVWQTAGATAGILITAAATYLVARRTTSGTVATSDAATLFAESREIRIELRAEVATLRGDNAVLRERVAVVERENRDLRVQNIAFEAEVNAVRAEEQGLKARVRTLEAEVHELRGSHG